MSLLFSTDDVRPDDIPKIPGLSYFPNYISEEEERALASAIDREAWDTTWDRRRQPYGWSYGKSEQPPRSIPDWGRALVQRLQRDGIGDPPFNQMLVNEYFPSQGIAMHCDYQPFDRTVVSLSLLSPCVMDFRRVRDGRRESLLLARRSLLVLSDEARYDWQHGIARRKNDRWQGMIIPRARRLSVTFRLSKRSR
jgi:alkylated DNA repair dioxygenase AlkB